jgi:transcriptional regulator with XRE-family HTH domain
MKTFGEVIAELRKERGLTQKALAARLKKKDGTTLGTAYVNDIEHDRRGPPAAEFVRQLAEVLETPLEVLQFYAGRLPAETQDERRKDPSQEQIVAAYRAFRKELQTKKGG